jgi:iron-sulfur cluster insertion protein
MGSNIQVITISESAIAKIKDIIAEENNPTIKLRVGVQGGGCSGMQYFFTLDDEFSEDEDFVVSVGDISVIVDSISSQYLRNAEIDYREDIHGSNFSINNPNAQTSCGCGSSFSVSDGFYDNHYSGHEHTSP